MTKYKCEAVDQFGRKRHGDVEAESRDDAIAKLEEAGMHNVSVEDEYEWAIEPDVDDDGENAKKESTEEISPSTASRVIDKITTSALSFLERGVSRMG